MPPYRGYFFGNVYLSQIQHGIQAAHVVTRMFAIHGQEKKSKESEILYEWAKNPTKILLNGGTQKNLLRIHHVIANVCKSLNFPYALFNEDEDSLNQAVTSVGVVVPTEIFDFNIDPLTASQIEFTLKHYMDGVQDYENAEFMRNHSDLILATLIKSYRLA